MRLFIGIELPKQFQSEVTRLQKELKQVSCGGRFVPAGNFHITLHFIGESDDIVGAAQAMHEAVRGIRPFALHMGKYGSLERDSRGRTSIVHILGDLDELKALHESLEGALFDRGFSRERKRFVPHITLGRSVEHDDLAGLELERITSNASMSVQSIVLFESARVDGRMVYTPLHKERI